jgi:hypothetical protein
MEHAMTADDSGRMTDHAPLPWTWETASKATANGNFHVYLVDANNRKIAAIWGPLSERIKTAELILRAVNGEEPPKVRP